MNNYHQPPLKYLHVASANVRRATLLCRPKIYALPRQTRDPSQIFILTSQKKSNKSRA